MAEVPYRLWSEQAPEPAPPVRTIVVKLKPTTREGRRATFGVRSEAARSAVRGDTDDHPSQIGRLLQNARVKAVRPVFPDEALALQPVHGPRAGGGPRFLRRGVSRARGLVTLEVARNEDPKRLTRYLDALGAEVEYAFIPQPRRMFAKKSKKPDPFLSRQWGHIAVHVAQARAAASFVEATKIVVAVVDSGIDRTHPDLGSVVVEYKNFLKGEGSRDYEGHGTHVAGIIAARMNNGVGIAGLCGAKILAIKVLPGRTDWEPEAYYRGLAYCIGRAQVLNLSLGDESFDPAERDVLMDVMDEGIVVVAAMGNEYEQGNPIEYPAALKGVCAVGATDHADRRGDFSNTGTHMSLSAPGVGILSTTPTFSSAVGKTYYDAMDGSSMAAPHVSAAAALILAVSPDLTPAQVVKKLQRSCDKVPGMKKRPNSRFGWGRLNIEAALRS